MTSIEIHGKVVLALETYDNKTGEIPYRVRSMSRENSNPPFGNLSSPPTTEDRKKDDSIRRYANFFGGGKKHRTSTPPRLSAFINVRSDVRGSSYAFCYQSNVSFGEKSQNGSYSYERAFYIQKFSIAVFPRYETVLLRVSMAIIWCLT